MTLICYRDSGTAISQLTRRFDLFLNVSLGNFTQDIFCGRKHPISHSQRIPLLGNTSDVTRHASPSKNIYLVGMRMSGCRTERLLLLAHPPSLFMVPSLNHSDYTVLSNKFAVRCGPSTLCSQHRPLTHLFVSAPNHSVSEPVRAFEFVIFPQDSRYVFFFYLTHLD